MGLTTPPRASAAHRCLPVFFDDRQPRPVPQLPRSFFQCPDRISASARAHHCLCYPLYLSWCVIVFYMSGNRCGAVDGCLTPFMTPFGEHKEDYSDRKARCSMLLIAITDTRRIRYFVGGFPGSRGDSLAFRARSWCSSMEDLDAPLRPMSDGEFTLVD